MKIEYESIGTVHSIFKDLNSMPRQPRKAEGSSGVVEVSPKYEKGLRDLDGFSHIVLLCHFHRVADYHMDVVPWNETEIRGLFSTRSPRRPNPIGYSVVCLERIEGNRLYISEPDILDGTPVLDIKPYFREFDDEDIIRTGLMRK